MDTELARTLGELEQKLLALERTLGEIADSRHSGAERRPPAPPPPAPASPEASDPWVGSAGRIVDEAVEPPPRRPAPGAEPLPPAAPAPVAAPASVAAPPPASAHLPAGAHLPAAAPPRPAREPLHAPPRPDRSGGRAGAGGARPLSAELLRFRERLEAAARELSRDYDELLGRLSYPAMPATISSTISFARGVPSLDIIDVDGLRDAAVRAFDSDPDGTTAYGTSVGYPRLRSWIADRHGVEPERVLVTNGSLQADAFLFDELVRPGDEVIVESPTYDRTLLSLRHRGAQLHAVALEHDGLDVAALERLLAGGAGPGAKLAHVIPNFQNPAGYTLSLAKRERLLELAREHDFIVLEDDPYVELRFGGEPLPSMVSMDRERVVYASSFTKTVCPGVRVGYLIGPTELIAAVGKLATNTYISPGMVAQAIVYEFCASGAIDRSIETVKTALAQRASALAGALRNELPEARFIEPQGGYFMWVTLPEGIDAAALLAAAGERGVSFVKGSDFLLEGGENALRLAYSGVTPQEIEVGVARLAEAYRSL